MVQTVYAGLINDSFTLKHSTIMKKIFVVTISLLLFSGATYAQKPKAAPKAKPQPEQKSQTAAPAYSLVVKASTRTGLPLQSFVSGRSGDNLLILGGRTNGFHGTDATDSTINFPASLANQYIVVYNPVTATVTKASIPAQYFDQLTSTNMQSCQDGDILYVCGGYGKNSKGNYVTYSGLLAVNVPKMINGVLNGESNLGQYIVATDNPHMAVTGGELLKIRSLFYLVMGQKFTGQYAPLSGTNLQEYTNEIRQFSITLSGSSLSSTMIRTFKDSNSVDSNSRFHRRDLNVLPIIDGNGKEGIAVYGGVFTQKVNGVWQNPVYVLQDMYNQPVVTIDPMQQKFNQYGCAHVLIFDPLSRAMCTSLIGGISYYAYSDKKGIYPDPGVPFSKAITTLTRYNGVTTENYASSANALAEYVGAESVFMPLQSLAYTANEGMIDYTKIPASAQGTLIGYMFGGIQATAAQSNNIYPTFTNKTLYEVYLIKQ
jgi:ligand-binding sensor protein